MSGQKRVQFLKRVGAHIKAWRLKRRMTQEEAAHRSRIDYKRWQRIEQGGANVTLVTLGRIAAVLRVPPDRLLRP